MEVVDKNPVKAIVVIVRKRAIVVFQARDETASILGDTCEEEGFTGMSRTVAIDMGLAQFPTLQLRDEALQRLDHRLRKSGHEVVDIITGDRCTHVNNGLKGLLPGHGVLDVLSEQPDGGSGSEHDGSDGVVVDEGSDSASGSDMGTDDADSVEGFGGDSR